MFPGYSIPTRITYQRKSSSYYEPSSHMMDYIAHLINSSLIDNFHFKQTELNYHPYILRLYFAILFWIQCLRAANHVFSLTIKQHQCLNFFLQCHPLETLRTPGPLVPLFKTLCSSQPEFSTYGEVYPILPIYPGPKRRSDFMNQSATCRMLPNVPGILALLEHLSSLINAENPVYPTRIGHVPVNEGSVIFGHHNFPSNSERTDSKKWSLVSSRLQYPCEADRKLKELFAEWYGDFGFPETTADDNLQELSIFLGMDKLVAWFSQVKQVAASAAKFFQDSSSLADCGPSGLVSNQVIAVLLPPAVLPSAPTHSADERSVYRFSFKLKSTARKLPVFTEDVAAFAQTHTRMFQGHPYYADHGSKKAEHGPFWSLRPIESSPTDDSSYLSVSPMVRKMMKVGGHD